MLALAGFELTPTAPLDKQRRCCGARGDRCIRPAERETARRHYPSHVAHRGTAAAVACGCVLAGPGPRRRPQALAGSPAVREGSADYLDAAARRSPRGIVTIAAAGQALSHEGYRRQPTGPDECNGDEAMSRSGGRVKLLPAQNRPGPTHRPGQL